MGQANARGTREERVAQAIGRKQLERETARLAAEARAAAHKQWLDSLTPEQREDLNKRLEAVKLHQAILAGTIGTFTGRTK